MLATVALGASHSPLGETPRLPAHTDHMPCQMMCINACEDRVSEKSSERCAIAGVTLGAFLGHALATLLAVTGGALASKYISERALGFAGGSLFLIFAALTLFGVF